MPTRSVKPLKASPLGEYRRKRNAADTNEPFGGELPETNGGTLSGAFVVHLHDATRRHYDLRIQVGGVLASFAVPRGPSLDPDAKALAVKTEDHPIEYLEFEDVIPAKQYGAGAMIAWDRGMVEYLEGPAEEEIANGKLHFELRGLKLRGRFALIKLANSQKGNEWLLFKKADAHSSTERVITEELPRSVFSGLTVDELEQASVKTMTLAKSVAKAPKLSTGASLSLFQPSGDAAPTGAGWVYDAELDGVRVLATKHEDAVALGSETERIEAFYPDVVRALRALPVAEVALDGVLVAFDRGGHPSLPLLAQRASRIAKGDVHRAITEIPVVLVATDLLALGDADVRALPLTKRRAALEELLPGVGFLRAAPPLEGDLAKVLALCAAHGVPGVVAKRKTAPYGTGVYVSSGLAPRSRTRVDHDASEAERVLRRVTVTNRQKVFWPAEGYTKGDLIEYYATVADVILPYLRERPVILVRYPDGIDGKSFFQWNVPQGMPPWVRTLSMHDDAGETRRGFLIDDPSTLTYIANLACIPLHILGSRVPNLDRADFLTMDFDVKQSELRHAITLAKRLKRHLDAIGLPSFPKTSGQSGLHVIVPLGEGQSFTTARALVELLGKLLVEEYPEIATMDRVVGRRGARVYVDTGQTGTTRAIVAPYSVRAAPGATVSTPLDWAEVEEALDPRAFTMKTVPKRLAKLGDPMAKLLTSKPNIAAAVGRLGELVGPASSRNPRPA